MDLSVIVAVYNHDKVIRRCVESLLGQKQTALSVEILLIDDGSADESAGICDSYSEQYDWIHTFHKKNGGCVDSRRYGIARAKGNYIAFVDGDDYVESDYLKNIERALLNPADYYIFNNKKTFFLQDGLYVEKNFLRSGYLPLEIAAEWVLLSKASAVWDKLFSRQFIEKNNISIGENISQGEDMYINSKILMHRPKIYAQNTSSYVHIANSPTSIFVMSAKISHLEDLYIMYKTGKELIDQLELSDRKSEFEIHILGEFVKNIGLMVQGGERTAEIRAFFLSHSDLSFIHCVRPKTLKGKIFAFIMKSESYHLARVIAGVIHTKMYYRRLDKKVSDRTVLHAKVIS